MLRLATSSGCALLSLIVGCSGHGHMTLPPSRNGGTLSKAADCMYGECMWFSQPVAGGTDPSDRVAEIPGEPTNNDASDRTYNMNVSSGDTDYTRTHPWRAPGSAPVIGSGCGRAGGGPMRQYDGGTGKEFGWPQNMDGADLPELKGNKTIWAAGSVVEVAWANNANHGGGYAYRLCKKGTGNPQVTEECFQKGHLDFVGDTSWLKVWHVPALPSLAAAGPAPPAPPMPAPTVYPVERVTVSKGTSPAGSQWARVPIPACKFTGTSPQMARFDFKNCPGDCAGCCADPEKVALPPHPRINGSWWRAQDCVAMCAGNGLPGTCPAGDVQFKEPVEGLSSLWSSWLWCDAPRTGPPSLLAKAMSMPAHASTGRPHGNLGDGPRDMPCSKNNLMMQTNIVDKVQVPEGLGAGEYVLSWRWDCEQTKQIWQNCADVTIQ